MPTNDSKGKGLKLCKEKKYQEALDCYFQAINIGLIFYSNSLFNIQRV